MSAYRGGDHDANGNGIIHAVGRAIARHKNQLQE
jgi:hypothetical protein